MNEKSPCGRRYDREFKENAVALVRGGRRITAVARDPGGSAWALGRRVQAAHGGQAQSEPKTLAAERDEARARRRLRQEVDHLRQPRDLLKKSVGQLVSGDAAARHALLETMKDDHPIAALAAALEVSKSGFFAHRKKGEPPRRRADRALVEKIAPIFAASRQTSGCPRVTAVFRQSGQRGGKNRVARLRRENPLVPKQKRKRWRPRTTAGNPWQPVAQNWLSQGPAPSKPDQVRGADLTCIDTGEGRLYLAGLLDACTRRCVGWQTGESLEAGRVIQAWQKAVRTRRPPPGQLHHSERGTQDARGAMRGRPRGDERAAGCAGSRRVDEPHEPPRQLRR